MIFAFTLLSCAGNKESVKAQRSEAGGGDVGPGAAQPAANTKTNKPAPGFSIQDAGGKTVTLAEYKGKVVLLNFWATWCGPCKVEIPWFSEFERKYKDRGLAVLGVAMDDEGWDVVKPYLQKNNIAYRIAVGNDKLAESYGGVESLPTTFIIDRDGTIAAEHQGLVSKDDYEKEIVRLLDKRAARGGSDGADGSLVIARAKHP